MSTENDIRAELFKASETRGEISKISKALGIAPSTVARWIPTPDKPRPNIPPPMLKLLNLYFFEVMPFDIVGEKLLNSVLDFTEDQYRIICILATRQSCTPAKWITNQIRAILNTDEEARTEAGRFDHNSKALRSLPDLKVAKDTGTGRKAK